MSIFALRNCITRREVIVEELIITVLRTTSPKKKKKLKMAAITPLYVFFVGIGNIRRNGTGIVESRQGL